MLNKNKYKRSWAYGSNAIVTTFVFVGILAFIVLIAERHQWRVDLTESGKYTLSSQTRKILDNLKEPVKVTAFCQSASEGQGRVTDILETYAYYSKNITYRFVDPDREPEIAQGYDVRTYDTLVLEGFQKKSAIQSNDEESITNAILKLMRGEEKKIYFLIGHGERSLKDTGKDGYSNARAMLEKGAYKVEDLSLLQSPRVPRDAAVLIVAGPRKPIGAEEIASLAAYVAEGGKLLLLLDPFYDGGLRNFAKNFGVELRDDVIVDKVIRIFGGNYLIPVVTDYGDHKITEGFNVATFYPEARSVRPVEKPPAGTQVEVLASTSSDSWGETNLELLKKGQANFDEKEDTPGPVPLAVISEIHARDADSQKGKEAGNNGRPAEAGASEGEKNTALLAVFGNSVFADNTLFEQAGNGDLFMRTVSYLADQDILVTIKARDIKGKPVILTQGQGRIIFAVSMVLVPLSVILAGLVVYRTRRDHR